jgi:hypothetical protein
MLTAKYVSKVQPIYPITEISIVAGSRCDSRKKNCGMFTGRTTVN